MKTHAILFPITLLLALLSSAPLQAQPVTLSLSGSTVEAGARSGTAVGRFGVSTGDVTGFTFALVSGTGDTENAHFTIDGRTLRTVPALLLLPGASASIRVRATEGAVQVEQVFTLTIQQGMPNTVVLPVPPPDEIPGGGSQLGLSVATDGVRTVLGAPLDNSRGNAVGTAKVFDNATGQLLHVLKHPTNAHQTRFGYSVAIDGDWVVVACEASSNVFVFDLGSSTPEEPAYVLAFGRAVAISGNLVVVGEKFDNVGSITAAGRAHVYNLASTTPTAPLYLLTKPVPVANDLFGTAVAISGTQVVVGVPGDDTGGSACGIAYKFDLGSGSPSTPVAVISNPTPNSGDFFGSVVAIAPDGRVAVGCPLDDTSGADKGRAYLFNSNGTLANAIANPNPSVLKDFGQAISLSNTRLVIGTSGSTIPGAPEDGSVVIYDITTPAPTLLATLVNPEANPLAGPFDEPPFFGETVALGGDKLVVGRPKSDDNAPDAGNAYLYDLASATPSSFVWNFHHESPSSGDGFGGGYAGPFNNSGVAISGSRMVVAAPGVQRAYVYDFAGASPDVPIVTLKSPTAGTFNSYASFYGRSVAMDGNLVVVGSEDVTSVSPTLQGVVYVYDLTSATPDAAAFVLPNPVSSGSFGVSVAISGRRVVVSSPETSIGGGVIVGRVYVFDLDGATPTVPVATLQSPIEAHYNSFGNDVAISGNRIAVGAYMDPPTTPPPPGRVYVYDWSGPVPVLQHTIINPTPYNGQTENFAENIALSGSRLLVGARDERSTANVSGAAYLYDLDGATPTTPALTIADPSGLLFAQFGMAVALSGTRAAISAVVSGQSVGKFHRVYLYDFASATPTVPVATLLNPQPTMAGDNSNDYFGESVAISGSLMAVGAEGSDIEVLNKGYVWVYGPAPANTAPVVTLTGANPLNYEARATYTDPGATATDVQDGTITPVISNSTVVANVPGTYSVTWSATDSIGAVDTKTRTVNVFPNAPPTLSAPMGGFVPLALREGSLLPDYAAAAIASDNSGSVTVTQSIAPASLLAPGTYTITLTATDGAGNQTTLSFTVTVNALPATGIFSDDFPLHPKNMWWHNDFTAHPTNGWIYGTCARGGQYDKGMIYRVNTAGEYQTLVHLTDSGLQNRGTEAAGQMALGADGNFYGVTADGMASTLGSVFKMTPEGAFTTLAQFTGTGGASPGDEPTGGLVKGLDGNFYGTTQRGGTDNRGVVFKCTPGGTLTALVQFTGTNGVAKGSYPIGSLAVGPDGALYGTTLLGGSLDLGTVFKVTTGGVFTTLVEFTSAGATNRGHNPNGGLTLAADGNFYGMTTFGGAGNIGTVFRMTPGGNLTTLVEFTGNGATGKGSKPVSDLTLGSDGHLYGLTSEGGANNKGTAFRITTDGVHTVLVHFTGNGSSNKGAFPKSTMAQGPDGNFYGNTQNGGAQDQGTVFKMTPTGTLTTLLESTNFYRGGTARGYYINGGLCQGPDGALYGMANSGGNTGNGTIFKIDAFGQRTTLVHFTGTSGAYRGGNPVAGLVLAGDGNFYGTTLWGGTNNLGAVFRMTPAGVYTVLVDFTGGNGSKPWSRLCVAPDGNMYAVTAEGGANGFGVAFRITTGGTYTKLFDFTSVGGANPGAYNSSPFTVGPDGLLYSSQFNGGNNDCGTIYKMTTEGVMTVLAHLDNNTGAGPCGASTFGPDGFIYLMTNYRGAQDVGTMLKISTTGTITKLFDFTNGAGENRGAWPSGTLFFAPDGFFYGTTNSGGANDMGTLFKMTTAGVMTIITDFKGAGSGIESGGWPYQDEFTLASDGRLYGMTNVGGRQGGGLVYRIEMPAPEIAVSGNSIDITNNDSTPSPADHTDFGQVSVASGTVVRTFTIANTGTVNLTLGTVSITGANAGDFTVTTMPATTVAAASSTTLGITFDPSARGARTAQVSFSTNDATENPFTFTIAGTGLNALDLWKQTHFGNATSNIGDLEDFDADGVLNILEFAFGTHPNNNANGSAVLQYGGTFAGGGTVNNTGQPVTAFETITNGIDFRALFVRRKDYIAAGLTYTPQFSADLSVWQDSLVVPTVLADDGTHQIVSVPYPFAVAGKKAHFFRISVSIAP